MEENGRYIILIVGAVVLMGMGIGGAYLWEKHRRVTRSSAVLELDEMFDQSAVQAGEAKPRQDTAKVEEKTLTHADSVMMQRREMPKTVREVRQRAEQEGFRWQQALQMHRYREPAENCMAKMDEESVALRDSLEEEYASHVEHDSLMRTYDRELQRWQERLMQEVELLPTARQALDAEQITETEYRKILKESTR